MATALVPVLPAIQNLLSAHTQKNARFTRILKKIYSCLFHNMTFIDYGVCLSLLLAIKAALIGMVINV